MPRNGAERTRKDYTIGWICAIEPELNAAKAALDEIHPRLPGISGDTNIYVFGSIGSHNIVVACLPSGTYGTNAAAVAATEMRRSFPELRFGLLVGVGGGVPNLTDEPGKTKDIRLGDVVVSDPDGRSPGVIQYDLGRTHEGTNWPERKGPEYAYQGGENDVLFKPGSKHTELSLTCEECNIAEQESRPARENNKSVIHYGSIASGNQVVKDSVTRDFWKDEESILCFEMEAAGLMDDFQCLVIRGICDYSDSHKNKRWQPYAAMAAAAYAKDVLLQIAPEQVQDAPKTFSSPEDHGMLTKFHLLTPFDNSKAQISARPTFEGARMISPHYVERKSVLAQLQRHKDNIESGGPNTILVHGMPGAGKTQITRAYAKLCAELDIDVFWLDASSKETLRASFISLAGDLRLSDEGTLLSMSVDHLKKLVTTHCDRSSHSNLFIYDNYDSFEEPYGYQLLPYLPSTNTCQNIVTSRNGSPIAVFGFEVEAETLPVQSMDEAEATALLSRILGCVASPEQELGFYLHKIACDLMGRLPLAVAQAGSYIRNMRRHQMHLLLLLKQYLENYETQEDRLLRATDGTFVKEYGKSVITTFDMAFEAIQVRSYEAGRLLLLFGLFHHRDIDVAWFRSAFQNQSGFMKSDVDLQSSTYSWFGKMLIPSVDGDWDSSKLLASLLVLHDYSLIYLHPGNQRWDLHPLLHSWTRTFQRCKDSIHIQENAKLSAAILVESYDPDMDPKRLESDDFKAEVHEHIEAWLHFCESTTNLLSLPAPTISCYTLTRFIAFFDSAQLSAKHIRTHFIVRLVSIALLSGSKANTALDRYTLDKIGTLLLHVSQSFDLPATAVKQLFSEIRSIRTSIRETIPHDKHDDLIRNLRQLEVILRSSGDGKAAIETLEEVAAYTLQHRAQIREYLYYGTRGMVLYGLGVRSQDAVKRDSISTQLRLLVEEAVLSFGAHHQLCIRLRSKINLLETEMSDTNELQTDEIKRLAEQNPSLYFDDLLPVLDAEINTKVKELGRSAPGILKLRQRRRDIRCAKLGAYHPEVLEDDNVIYSYKNSNRGNVRQDRIPNTWHMTWPTMRNELVRPTTFLILTRIWHPDTSFEAVWSHLLINAEDYDVSQRVLSQCIATLGVAENRLFTLYPSLATPLRLILTSVEVKLQEETERKQESLLSTFTRLHRIWKMLETISIAWSQESFEPGVESALLSELDMQNGSILETEVFLVSNYIQMVLFRKSPCVHSPLTLATVGKLESLIKSGLGLNHVLFVQFCIVSAICYRIFEQVDQASVSEDFLISFSAMYYEESSWRTGGSVGESVNNDERLGRSPLLSSRQREALHKNLIGVARIAFGCLELVCETYRYSGLHAACARIYDSFSRVLAAKSGLVSPKVLTQTMLCGYHCNDMRQFQLFQDLIDDVGRALQDADTAAKEGLFKDVLKYWLPSMVERENCWRMAIILAETLKGALDSKEETTEKKTKLPHIMDWHWSFLKMLRKSYCGLGYTINAEDFIKRQELLEPKLCNSPQGDIYQSSIEEDRRVRHTATMESNRDIPNGDDDQGAEVS